MEFYTLYFTPQELDDFCGRYPKFNLNRHLTKRRPRKKYTLDELTENAKKQLLDYCFRHGEVERVSDSSMQFQAINSHIKQEGLDNAIKELGIVFVPEPEGSEEKGYWYLPK